MTKSSESEQFTVRRAATAVSFVLAAVIFVVSSQSALAKGPLDGFYVGGLGGYERNGLDLSLDGEKFDLGHISGASGAGILGWDLEMNKGHLAVEAEFGVSGASETITVDLSGDVFTSTLDVKRSFGIAARYGYAFGGDVLVYGRIGWTRTKVGLSLTGPGLLFSETTNVDGLSYGGGVEYALSEHVSLRGEYVRTDYEDILGAPLKPTRNAFRGGIAIRF